MLDEDTDGRLRRLSTLSPGMGFGEPALVANATRTAFVRADRASTCWVLPLARWRQIRADHPELLCKLLENLLRSSVRIVGRLTREAAEPAR